jgi:hypothetical protein
MKNVEVELYLNQFIKFFDNNPNDLMNLIGDLGKEEFYLKVKEQSYLNVENGEEPSLTQKQLIAIVVKMKKRDINDDEVKLFEKIFKDTKFGPLCLN